MKVDKSVWKYQGLGNLEIWVKMIVRETCVTPWVTAWGHRISIIIIIISISFPWYSNSLWGSRDTNTLDVWKCTWPSKDLKSRSYLVEWCAFSTLATLTVALETLDHIGVFQDALLGLLIFGSLFWINFPVFTNLIWNFVAPAPKHNLNNQ